MSNRLFPAYPEMIDEHAARVVAGLIAFTAAFSLATGHPGWVAVLAPGFFARAVLGPRFSGFAFLARRVVLPRLSIAPHPTWSVPKRFAQAIGLAFSLAAGAAALTGAPVAATVLTAVLFGCASLESAFGFCVGCKVYGAVAVAWEDVRVWNHQRKAARARV